MLVRREFLIRAGLLALKLSCSSAMPALGQAEGSLSPAEKWKKLPDSEKRHILERWDRFKGMSPGERTDLEAAARRFQEMAPTQQADARANYESWKTMNPAEKTELKARYARWKALLEKARESHFFPLEMIAPACRTIHSDTVQFSRDDPSGN